MSFTSKPDLSRYFIVTFIHTQPLRTRHSGQSTIFFVRLTPPPYTQFRDPGVRLAPREAFRLWGKEVVFFKLSGRGSNPEPRASEEDALSTPLRPTWL